MIIFKPEAVKTPWMPFMNGIPAQLDYPEHSMCEAVERIAQQFELGGHKAAAIGMVLDRARIDLVSEMEDDFVRSIFLNPQPSAQTAFDKAMETYGEDATVIAMPFGGATLPYLE